MVKNSPSNAGDVGSIPGRGAKISHATGRESSHATMKSPQDTAKTQTKWRASAAKSLSINQSIPCLIVSGWYLIWVSCWSLLCLFKLWFSIPLPFGMLCNILLKAAQVVWNDRNLWVFRMRVHVNLPRSKAVCKALHRRMCQKLQILECLFLIPPLTSGFPTRSSSDRIWDLQLFQWQCTS